MLLYARPGVEFREGGRDGEIGTFNSRLAQNSLYIIVALLAVAVSGKRNSSLRTFDPAGRNFLLLPAVAVVVMLCCLLLEAARLLAAVAGPCLAAGLLSLLLLATRLFEAYFDPVARSAETHNDLRCLAFGRTEI